MAPVAGAAEAVAGAAEAVPGTCPGPHMRPSIRPVFLTGVPRSGTTWVGRVLFADPSVFEVYEPFNPAGRDHVLLRHPARHLDDQAPLVVSEELRRAVGRMLSLRLDPPAGLEWRRPRRLLADLGQVPPLLAAKARGATVVMKDPTAGHLTGWLHREFGVRPAVLVRHPCGNAAGHLRMGWSGVSAFLQRPGWASQLRPGDHRYLEAHGTGAKGDPVLSAALEWRATNGMLLGLRDTIPELVVVRYEDLASDPARRFPRLAADLGLPWGRANAATLEQLRGPALDQSALGAAPHVLNRDPAATASSWRDRLRPSDVERVLEHAGPLAAELGYGP